MRLKLATTGLLLFGLVLLLGWPWIVGPRPEGSAASRELQHYTIRFGIYIIALLVTFFVTTVFAFMVARREREAYREEARENMRLLIEGTLRDHHEKSADRESDG